jgi:putative peptidoglycan lipid II flippase
MSTPPFEESEQSAVAPDDSIAVESDAPFASPEAASFDSEEAATIQSRSSQDSKPDSTGRSVAKATAGIGVLHVVRLLVGFATQPLIANRLGLDWHADASAVANDIVFRVWLLFEKVVNPAVLPCFAGAMKDEGEERAWRFASTVLWLTVFALLVITPLAWFGMPFIVGIYSQKAGLEQREATVDLARLLLSGLFFLAVSSLTYVLLNGYKRFMAAALGDAFWKMGLLAGAAVAVASHAAPGQSLKLIAWGYLIGAFGKLLPQVLALKSKWHLVRPRIDWSDPLTKKMLMLAIPLVAGIFVSEVRSVYLARLADDPAIQVEASRAALKWSRIIGDSLIQVFPYAMSIGIFPYLADLARDRDRQPLTDTLLGALRVCVFCFGPITAILIATRFELLRAVWESGKLTQADTVVMSLPFVAFALGLIAFACEMMLNQTFYAMTNAWTPTLIGISTTVVWIIAATFGVQYGAAAGWGLAAIAGAESFSKTLKCILMWLWLRPHLGDVKIREQFGFWIKVFLGSILAALVAGVLARVLAGGEIHSKLDKIKMLLGVALSGTGGVLVYLVFGYFSGIREVQLISAFAGKIKKRLA